MFRVDVPFGCAKEINRSKPCLLEGPEKSKVHPEFLTLIRLAKHR